AGEVLTFGDHTDGIHGLLVEAARAPGFGSAPVDLELRRFLDSTFGAGRYLTDRPPHRWERFGGDVALDDLFAKLDTALAELRVATAARFERLDQLRAAQRQSSVAPQVGVQLARALQEAIG